jgi:N-hydroxyarylamine O-acetyltransferase
MPMYLARVGLDAVPPPNRQGLFQVHAAQAFTIPFENLDIHLGRPILLSESALLEKLVMRRRGGYCFELNGLFCLALRALGFAVQVHLARVLYRRATPGARTHQFLIVNTDGQDWLADVGFGGPGLREPLPLRVDEPVEQYGERFRLKRDQLLGIVLQKQIADAWTDLYAFAEELTLPLDIEMANHFASTWSESLFCQRRICALAAPWGRVTLMDHQLSVYRDGAVYEQHLPAGEPYIAALAEHFNIRLDADFDDLILPSSA